MQTPMGALEAEHEELRRLLRAIQGMAGALHQGHRVDPRDLHLAVRVLHEFADGWHHRKEHDAVLPAVRKSAKDAKPALQELARHDEECHALAERLRGLADAAAGGDVRDQVHWRLAAVAACRAWEQHIRAENRVLAPLLARMGKRQQAEVWKAMAAIDAKVPDHQRHGRDIERLLQAYARYAVAA